MTSYGLPTSRPSNAAGRIDFLRLGLLASLLSLSFVAGCQKEDQVRRYVVAKPPPVVRPSNSGSGQGTDEISSLDGRRQAGTPDGVPTRVLAVVVPREKQTWFFKLSGPTAAVTEQAEPLLTFLHSLKFADETPTWTLPEGWT